MKDFFKHNRIAAIIALVLIVALSTLIGVNRSMGSLAGELQTAYETGSDEYGSAAKDIKKFCSYFNELYGIVASAGIPVPEYASELSELASSPFGKSGLVAQAYNDAANAYNRFINIPGLQETAANEAIRCFAELQSMQLRIKNNLTYNDAAKEYNKALGSFPASIFDFMHSPAAVFD